MFTLLVSWLLVACIPWLLMLAALGLGRLEKALAHDTVTSIDVAEFLQHAEASDVRMLARKGMPEALESLHRRQAQRLAELPPAGSRGGAHHADQFFATELIGLGEAGLPTRVSTHSRPNPQFTATRHVNRV
jgi:hypothetical protein